MKKYIAINMDALSENNLSMFEWALLENIYFLSNNDYHACYASKEALAEWLGVSGRQIFRFIADLTEKSFLTKNDFGHLKVTQKWLNIVSQNQENSSLTNSAKSAHTMTNCQSEGMTNCQSGYDKMSYKERELREKDIKGDKSSEVIHSEAKASSFITSSPLTKNENSNLQKNEKNQISTQNLPDFINPALWDDWTRHRREIGHSLKPTTIQKQLKQLAEWQKQGYDANKIIEQSIMNGWQGLFLLKKSKIEQNPLPAEIEQAVREGKISEEGAYSYASALNWLKRYEEEA
ncbi:MAG: hypothetical protein LBP40_04020 [Campylobacteraceae bacterium]|jgi:hypothetical protein|nr:hypothetical protein [Campylobacteraceae bacterium]